MTDHANGTTWQERVRSPSPRRLEQIAGCAEFGCGCSEPNFELMQVMLKELVAMACEDKALILRLLPAEQLRQERGRDMIEADTVQATRRKIERELEALESGRGVV